MLKSSELAKRINTALGATDKDGLPIAVTAEMETYAKAVLTLKLATTAHAPGTVTGTTAPGAPLVNGAAMNGLLVGFVPAPWLGELTSGFPTADPSALAKDATLSVGYINGAAKINFQAGNITGTCTNTAEAPGPLAAGAGTGGTIDELNGSDWAKIVLPPLGDPAMAERVYQAISDYINEEAEVTYASGTVTGTCPPASGTLQAGTAAGGTIT